MLQHLDPKRGWARLSRSHRRSFFHKMFQSLWSEYFRSLERLRDLGGLRPVEERKEGLTGGPWVSRDVRIQDFDPIILSLIHAPPEASTLDSSSPKASLRPPSVGPVEPVDPWARLTLAKVIEHLSLLGVAPTARQLHLVLQYYTLQSIFHLAPTSALAVRERRRRTSWDRQALIDTALKVWARRRRLGRRVESLIRGVRTVNETDDELKRWADLPYIHSSQDPEHVMQLRLTLGEMTMACLEEAIRLKSLIQGKADIPPENADLDREIRYWIVRRDSMIKDWRDELLVTGGVLQRWGGEDASMRPSPREQSLIKLLLRDSLLQDLRHSRPAHVMPGLMRLDDPIDLIHLYIGRYQTHEIVPESLDIGGIIVRTRNAFYHQRRFADLLSLIHFLAQPPCPALPGFVFATLLCAARNPEQFAHLLISLMRLSPPITSASIDQSSRRMLLFFAKDASLTGFNTLLPPELREGGYKVYLLRAFDRWGTGVPGDVFLDEATRRKFESKREKYYQLKVTTPRLLAQRTKGKHLEWEQRGPLGHRSASHLSGLSGSDDSGRKAESENHL